MYLERMQTAIISSLPKDCAYSRPFLRTISTVPGPGPGNDLGLLPRAQGPYGKLLCCFYMLKFMVPL